MADAHGSGPCEGYLMRVQVSFPAANAHNPNSSKIITIGDWVGFLLWLEYPTLYT